MEPKLLSRDDFREGVFLRDNHQCVICKEPGKDAHHIIERSNGFLIYNICIKIKTFLMCIRQLI